MIIESTTPVKLVYEHVTDKFNECLGLILRLERGSETRVRLFSALMINFERAATGDDQLAAIAAVRAEVQALLDAKVSAADVAP